MTFTRKTETKTPEIFADLSREQLEKLDQDSRERALASLQQVKAALLEEVVKQNGFEPALTYLRSTHELLLVASQAKLRAATYLEPI